MSDAAAHVLLWIAALYIGVGCVVALAMIAGGLSRIDSSARHAPLTFRLIVTPGLIALWPWALVRWVRTNLTKANEGDAHDA